jgi:hypothetical protein
MLIRSALAFALIVGAIVLTLCLTNPPQAVSEDAPATEFSAARALKHLSVISARPHPLGSAEHDAVFEYLVRELTQLNGPPEIQTTKASKDPRDSQSLRNIMTRVRGTDPNGGAVMLVAHYDSVPKSFGASDDGSGVVTLLETMRALKAAPPLKNDVIYFFSDGEELDTLGAHAFVSEHPWGKDVKLVLNFEARGSGGPVFMFETSKANGRLIREFASTAPRPFTNSLMTQLYGLMGNVTDLTVFKQAGLAGFNFAYIGSGWNYHNAGDNISNVDSRSVQHDGSYALSLTRHFGNLDLRNLDAPDEIYFDVLGRKVFVYPRSLNLVFTIGLVLLAAVGVVLGLKTKRVGFSGLAWGTLLYVAISVAALLVTTLLAKFLPVFGPTAVYAYWVLLLIAALIGVVGYVFATRRLKTYELSAGALLVLLLLTVVTNLVLPEGSFLLTWPLALSLIALIFSFLFPARVWSVIVVGLFSFLGIVLFTQMLHNLFQGFSLAMPYVLIGLEMLLLGLFTPFLPHGFHFDSHR